MGQPAIARVPTKPPVWQLTDACGQCAGCRAKALAYQAIQVVEEQLLGMAKELNPKQMRSDDYFRRLDDICKRRYSMQELETDYRQTGCERLEIVSH